MHSGDPDKWFLFMRLIVQMDHHQGTVHKNAFIMSVVSVCKEKHIRSTECQEERRTQAESVSQESLP